MEEALPDCAGTLNQDEEPSSDPEEELEDDEPDEADDPDADDEEDEEEGTVELLVEDCATAWVPIAIPPASASVAPTLSAPAARRLRRAG